MLKTMKNTNYGKYCFLLLLLIGVSKLSLAGIMAETTRLIFPEGATERSLMLANTNDYPVLVQTWIDNGNVNNTPEKTDAPFIVLPTVFKMGAGEVRGIRIVFKNQSLPKDRESIFWLNLYEIPPTTGSSPALANEAKLLVAMNTQMKIFYRPKNLSQKPNQIQDNLQFALMKERDGLILTCHNTTPFYASFSSLKLITAGKVYKADTKLDMMVAPFSTDQFVFQVKDLPKGQSVDLEFMLITDTGLSQKGEKRSIFTSQ